MNPLRIVPLLVACVALALPATAQTLYKLIDKNGKVTYAEKPPANFDGKVIRMDIDPNANTAVLPKPGAGGAGESGNRDTETLRRDSTVKKKSTEEERLERARSKVDDAKQRLQDLIDNPSDDDVQRIGNVRGGSRLVPSEEYLEKIKRAEAAVKTAEEELERVEKGR
jgi:uncharacterized protein DUF4124